jgi:hypothetical protein
MIYGERSQVVKALGCGSSIRGFDSRRSPLIGKYEHLIILFIRFQGRYLNI